MGTSAHAMQQIREAPSVPESSQDLPAKITVQRYYWRGRPPVQRRMYRSHTLRTDTVTRKETNASDAPIKLPETGTT
jgi:hypothetical protein